MRLITWAIARLETAGHKVTYLAGRDRMHFDVEGLGSGLTVDQLCDLADQHGLDPLILRLGRLTLQSGA